MKKICVMLVEDNKEYQESIRLILDHTPGMELARTYTTAEIALRSLQGVSPPTPDLILLDLRLPGMSGLDALPYFQKYAPKAPVIILTQSDAEADVLCAIRNGASSYLLKTATAEEIIAAIRIAMDGGAQLDPAVASLILKKLKKHLPTQQPKPKLSDRELDVLKLLAEGLVKKEIATRLNIQYSTVDYHVGHIYEKLNVRNAPAAVNEGHRCGLFPSEGETD